MALRDTPKFLASPRKLIRSFVAAINAWLADVFLRLQDTTWVTAFTQILLIPVPIASLLHNRFALAMATFIDIYR
jgi:hypothetical protein